MPAAERRAVRFIRGPRARVARLELEKEATPAPGALPVFMTIAEVAALLRRNRFTVYHQLTRAPDKLPAPTRIFGRVLFERAAVQSFLANLPPQSPSGRGKWDRSASRTTAPTTVQVEQKARRGRPKKAEVIARRTAAKAAHSGKVAA